jgi:hypothetical protein
MLPHWYRFLPALALLLAAGCSRPVLINDDRQVQLDSGELKSITYESAPGEREVRVEVNATGAAVSVYVVQEKDEPAAMKALQDGKHPANLLVARENVQQSALVTRVPADNGFAVIVSNALGKPAQVSLKITAK